MGLSYPGGPAIDRLAREGVRFTDAHSPSAVCTPTRYGLLTVGRIEHRRAQADTWLKLDVVTEIAGLDALVPAARPVELAALHDVTGAWK